MNTRTRLTDVLARSCQPAPREYALHDSLLRGFALRVRPSGAKTWTLRIRQGGQTRRIALGDAVATPADIARQRAHALLCGSTLPAKVVQPPAMSLKMFAALYLERRLKDWRPSTRRTHQSYLANQLLPTLGHRPLDRISVPDVAEWFHTYSHTRPGGANRAVAVLSDLFSRAIEWGILPQDHPNPCFAIRRNRGRARGQMLNCDSLARLGAALDKYALIRPDAVDAIRLLLLTGARPGEIFGLQWQEVEGDRLVLSQAKRGPRSISLGKSAVQILNARRRHRRTSRFVFPHRTLPDHPLSLPAATTWRVLKREAVLPPTLRLHDLRHNFASHALLSGESLLVTGSLLGHSRPAMTARYAHLTDDSLLSAAQRIAGSIANLTSLAPKPRHP